ncbi:alkaline phosphatase PhoX [Mangrovimonas xylaniphaga]|uniref:alkaline phosphatase PhoX n=1 Tax=Mangrovimonas xylaniphaga TaxID=1645915 RepID=UPI000AABC249|nr:alkaline phosphatase PhoX [Mangrovimonas xylaniphaga]
MNNYYKFACVGLGLLYFMSCNDDDGSNNEPKNEVVLQSHSQSPVLLKLTPEFSDVNIYNLLTSEDQLANTPNFVYGSMADGAGLIKNADDTFTLINNIEADYSIARITLDETFKPVGGEHILNAQATASTAQCSGSLITPEEHGFGPLYLSGGEWGGSSNGVFLTDPFKSTGGASTAQMLTAMGQWSTENAVAIGKDAYPGKTVVFIGDDHSDNTVPSGQLGMYVGNQGDLEGGSLYGLKVTDSNVNFEMDMVEGQSYAMEFVELEETQLDLLDAEAKNKGVMGFSRLEDIDWRRGSADNNREIYFCVTGRSKPDLEGKGTFYGRVYKVTMNPNDPTGAGTITCVLDGDKLSGKAKSFHSPDNIVVTENYAYIQEDPNGYYDTADKTHYARLYQYNLNTGALKVVLECDQETAEGLGYGSASSAWEITGMIDISETVRKDDTFLVITQNHGWENDGFTDSTANASSTSNEGSMLYIIEGLDR